MDGKNRNTGAEGLLEILRYGLERDGERRTAVQLGVAPNMSGYRISPKCWTAQEWRWLPNSTHLNTETLPKLLIIR